MSEPIVRLVHEERSPIVADLLAQQRRTILRTEAERLLKGLPERQMLKQPFRDAEVQVLRDAQMLGALPRDLPPTQVEIEDAYSRSRRVETFAGEDRQAEIWDNPQFCHPLRIGKFAIPDKAAIAAAQSTRKGWWRER